MPFASSSIDVCITSHALEPNRSDLKLIFKRTVRITEKCIFVEPSYEVATDEVKLRMDAFGYIKELEKTITKLVEIIDKFDPSHVNPNNPSICYVVNHLKASALLKTLLAYSSWHRFRAYRAQRLLLFT